MKFSVFASEIYLRILHGQGFVCPSVCHDTKGTPEAAVCSVCSGCTVCMLRT